MKFIVVLAFLAATAVVTGCGSDTAVDPTETVTVTGTVKIDGKLQENAEVMFFAVGEDERTSGLMGLTDPQGQYTIPGVLPGEYRVQVDQQVNGAPDPALSEYKENSPLKASVSAGNTNFDFEVTRKK